MSAEPEVPDIPPVVRTVKHREVMGSADALGASIKRAFAAVASWSLVELSTSTVHVSDEFRMAESKRKAGQESPEHLRGELKTPAHDEKFWWLHAAEPAARIGLRAAWKETVTAKGGRGFSFMEAICADPLGMPTEHFASYEPDARSLKQVKDEPAWAHEARVARMKAEAERRDHEYNLGQQWQNRRPHFTSSKEFEAWLAEAASIVESVQARQMGVAA